MMEQKIVALTDVEFKASDTGPGSFTGYGAVFGNVDDGGDVIIQGAFKEALPSFLERGFVPVGHNWFDLPIASISNAKEDENGLWIEAEFHSTQSAQDARTVVKERIDRGKFVGLSIGYLIDYENDGAEYDDDGVRTIKKIKDLAEISIVTVPMNREAGVAAVKAGPGSVSFSERAARALAAVDALTEHAKEHVEMRTKEGRVLSSANRTRLVAIRDGLTEAAGGLDSILAETDPEKDSEKSNAEAARRWRKRADLVLAGIELGD